MLKHRVLLAALLCALMVLSGCVPAEVQIANNTQAINTLLGTDSAQVDTLAELFRPKMTLQRDSLAEPEKLDEAGIRAYLEEYAVRETAYENINILSAEKGFVALSYEVTDFYTRILEMPAVPYNAVYYFSRGQISKVNILQGDPLRDAEIAMYSKGSVGIKLEQDGQTVALVQPGSPAEAAGILPGDVVVAVDGLPVAEMDLAMDECAWQIRGIELSTVKMTLRRGEREYDVLMQRIAGLEA